MSRYKVLGVNDDKDFCECCGKEGLKKVVWIEDRETLEVKHFGTTCAESPTKAFGVTREIRKAVREHETAVKAAARKAREAVILDACREATDTFPGEWLEKTLPNGRVMRYPADSTAFDAHKKAVLATVGVR